MRELRRTPSVLAWMLCFWAAAAGPAIGAVRINEFLAENDGLVRDEDGATPDWIELHNNGPAAVNLDGWFLTDDAADLRKWRIPAVTLQPGGYLLVFASGKDRTNGTLHTNFQLDNAGEYLALVQPDGTTVAHEFAPEYPRQRANISYGLEPSGSALKLVASEAAAKVLVPADGSLGSTWVSPGFNDATWLSATTAVGFAAAETPGPGAVVLRLDMNARGLDTPANSMPGFNTFVIDGTAGMIITNPTVRAYGSISVTLSNTLGFGYGDRLNGAPATNGAFTDALLLRDYVYSRSRTNNGGLDLTLDGLSANRAYAITVWSFDSVAQGRRVSDWYANGMLVREDYTFDGRVAPTNNSQYRFTFEVLSDAAGGILISARRDSTSVNVSGQADYGVFLNALQVEELKYSSFLRTDLAALMQGVNASAYIRVPFTVPNALGMDELRLRMKYDDGFVAYVNGQQVAIANAPLAPSWNATATAVRGGAEALISELFITNAPGLLQSGANVLAIHGLNISAADTDFLLGPELDAIRLTGFFSMPTPGAANQPGFFGVVADTRFSADRGFYDAPVSVAITTATEGAAIYYTLNGSRPSPTNGFLYSSPLLITNTSFVRAAAYKAGYIPSDVDTHTYIFLDSVLRQPTNPPGYPAIWTQGSYPADYAMDPNVVDDPKYGATIKNDLRSIPTLSIVSDHNGLWNSTTGIYPRSDQRGTNWEREASAELIAGSGATEFATRCGVELHGNASRDNARTPKHSLRLSFKHEYGPTKLRHDWFGGGVDVHDVIVLRSCGFVDGWAGRYADAGIYTSTETGETFRGLRYRPENTCYLRDVWVKESFSDMGWSASRSAYVHLYINGLYWGLYQPSERLNAAYFQGLYGGEEGAWDVIVGEDNNGPPVIVDGSGVGWTNVLNTVNAGTVTDATYEAVAQLVDLDNLIDYMIVHIFAESEDWPRHNWYVAQRRATNGVPGTKFICSVWDQELTLDRLVRRNRVNVGNGGDGAGELYSPGRIYARLRASAEFRRHFGDRVQKHLFNGGALTPSNSVARLLAPAAIIREALVGESARWGDAREFTIGANPGTGVTFTRDEWWQPEMDKLTTNFLVKLTADNIARFRAGQLYPLIGAPELSQFGGAISNGFALEMTHTNGGGVIYFTTDDSDPRAYGTGEVAGNAQAYSEPVVMNARTPIKARVLSGTNWSALVDATFYPPQDLSKLALTEIMYNPPAIRTNSGDEFEFVELKNTGTNVLDLSGLVFSGLGFTFTNGTTLRPGEFFVLVRNPVSFALKYPGVTMNAVFGGRLDNGGETLRLLHPLATTVFAVSYDDEAPWPVAADNHNFSIVQSGMTQAPDRGSNWRASTVPGGSPGADDPVPQIPAVVINEVLSASVPPLLDQVELFNPTATAAVLGGWCLTDDLAFPTKFQIPDGTQIDPGGYLSFDETQLGFALSSHGEQVYLLSAHTNGTLSGYSHGVHFGAAADDVSFGRYINSAGEEQFPAQVARSFSVVNAGPRVGPVVINEIHYHPPEGGDEFIELVNISSTNVPLFDVDYPEVTWGIGGVDFGFPTDIVLPPNAYLLVVATEPADFRAKYSVDESITIVGPYFGVLQDSGERIKLERPGVPDINGLPYIAVDEVRYNDKAPWPPAADGAGPSLQRRDSRAYGDDPTNWLAAAPTPGAANALPDADADGLPDEWEWTNGTDPFLADASADPDDDGFINRDEYRAGTNPQDETSYLQLLVRWENGQVVLRFEAKANRPYEVLFQETLGDPNWSQLDDFLPAGIDRLETTSDVPGPTTTRFYRLVIP
jgi:hypothetical protein